MITVYVVLTGTFPTDIIPSSSRYLHSFDFSLFSYLFPFLVVFRISTTIFPTTQQRKEKSPPCPVACTRTFDLSNRTESGHVVSQERTAIPAEAVNALLYYLEFFRLGG